MPASSAYRTPSIIDALANLPASATRNTVFVADDGSYAAIWNGTAWVVFAFGAGGAPRVTIPGAYPYTTLDTDQEVAVNTTAARTIKLAAGATVLDQVIMDASDLSGTNPITVGVSDAMKSLNGVVNGTVSIGVNGALRGFHRDAAGNWHGGV